MTVSRYRGGRPPEAERPARRQAALDAALAEIADGGDERLTMQRVAQRAHSSKESLYAWFGSREGLLAEVVRQQSAATNDAVEQALSSDEPPAQVLRRLATSLLDLLTGDASVALNRAAMSSPALAATLLEHGRHTTGPMVERYLAGLSDAGHLPVPHPGEAFRLLYGLVVQDSQIRVLLGEPRPDAAARQRQAATAVERFLTLQALQAGTGQPRRAASRAGDHSRSS